MVPFQAGLVPLPFVHNVHGHTISCRHEIHLVSKMISDEELRSRARKSAEARIGFYIHFSAYLMVNAFLVALWWFTGGFNIFPWFIFPLFGWGIGVVAHGIATFGGPSYVDRKAEEEFRRLKKQQGL